MFFSLLALAIIGLPLLYNKFMSRLSPTLLGACAVAALLVWGLGMVLKVSKPDRDMSHLTGPDKALGYMMAKQIIEDDVPPGSVSVKNPVARGETWKKRNEARLAGIREAFKGSSYTVDEAGKESQAIDETKTEVSGIEGSRSGVATISFVGPPRNYSGEKHPYYVLVKTEHNPDRWYQALKVGHLSGVVRDLPPGKRSKPSKDTPGAVFDSRFQMIGRKNLPPKASLFPSLQSMSNK